MNEGNNNHRWEKIVVSTPGLETKFYTDWFEFLALLCRSVGFLMSAVALGCGIIVEGTTNSCLMAFFFVFMLWLVYYIWIDSFFTDQ